MARHHVCGKKTHGRKLSKERILNLILEIAKQYPAIEQAIDNA